jgi:hypothetical protein
MSGVFQILTPSPSPPGECVPPPVFGAGRTHSLGWEGVGGLEDARHCSVLCICKYFVLHPLCWYLFALDYAPFFRAVWRGVLAAHRLCRRSNLRAHHLLLWVAEPSWIQYEGKDKYSRSFSLLFCMSTTEKTTAMLSFCSVEERDQFLFAVVIFEIQPTPPPVQPCRALLLMWTPPIVLNLFGAGAL